MTIPSIRADAAVGLYPFVQPQPGPECRSWWASQSASPQPGISQPPVRYPFTVEVAL
ncbi:MAG: hypothetical protein WBB18_06965 [Nodosilinea sp.]